jgi:hypothetical protein
MEVLDGAGFQVVKRRPFFGYEMQLENVEIINAIVEKIIGNLVREMRVFV